ncbi:hypothetical protein PPROV_000337700 [Pycnococcus provasolii]|uniref:Uncharacterized protein n=1 Tax=Pycnococcus provasolii TaxID=41880 RepID=A0A830HDP0_9CHLO|nr:hypothetical protein PPROV_000337700 [Pycnococcus provasolii]
MGATKVKWSREEEDALREGVRKYGLGKWRAIQKDPEFERRLVNRTNVDLKDKWRNMSAAAQEGPTTLPELPANPAPVPKSPRGKRAANGAALPLPRRCAWLVHVYAHFPVAVLLAHVCIVLLPHCLHFANNHLLQFTGETMVSERAGQWARWFDSGALPCVMSRSHITSIVASHDAYAVIDALTHSEDRRVAGHPPKATALLLTARTANDANEAFKNAPLLAFPDCALVDCVLAYDVQQSSASSSDLQGAVVDHLSRCKGGGAVIVHLGTGENVAELVPTLLPLLGESGSFEHPTRGGAVGVRDAVVVLVLQHTDSDDASDDERDSQAKVALERAALGQVATASRREAARALRRRVDATVRASAKLIDR